MTEAERIAEVVRSLKDGTWRLPATQEFSKDFLDRIIPGRQRHTWQWLDPDNPQEVTNGTDR